LNANLVAADRETMATGFEIVIDRPSLAIVTSVSGP
jgi:hypothetical protein